MDYTAINITMQLFGSLMLIVLFVSQIISADRHEPLTRIFTGVIALFMTTMICDVIAWALDGMPGNSYRIILFISNFLVFSSVTAGSGMFIAYVAGSIPLSKRNEQRIIRVTWIIAAVYIFLLIVSQFTGWIYSIDSSNGYHMGPLYWTVYMVHMLFYLILLVIVLLHRKLFNTQSIVAYLAYIILPFAALAINFVIVELMLAHVSMALAILIIFVNIHVQRERLMREQKIKMQNQQIAIMLSQIQPHFLYNSLVVIEQLCDVDPKMAAGTVVEFSEYLRANLDSLSLNEPIPFQKELHHVENYLSIEKKRFGEKLNIVYDIRFEEFMLPALTLQPIVENAVRYGITRKTGGGTVTIKAEETENGAFVTVIDDGVGFDPWQKKFDGRSHIGIENVRNRLAAMCDGVLEIQSKPGVGTTAIIKIPHAAGRAGTP